MASTYTLISSNTLSSSAASVTFSSIPSTYTDLVVRFSARMDSASFASAMTFNSDTATNYSRTLLQGDGASATSSFTSSVASMLISFATDKSTDTANTFSNGEIYIPNYTVSANKPVGWFSPNENNAITAYIGAGAGLWRNTAAITSITLNGNNNFVSGSSFYLYGIKNS